MTKLMGYREQVRDAIARRTGEALLNGSIDHAAVIVQETFSSAKKSIRLLSSKLDAECYGRLSVRNAAQVFLADPDHSAEILVESSLSDDNDNFEWAKHPFLSDLAPFGSDGLKRLQVRTVPKEWVERYKFNFLLMDDYGYRYESDRKETAAVVAFLPEGEKGTVDNLNGIFDRLWNVSKVVSLIKPAPTK